MNVHHTTRSRRFSLLAALGVALTASLVVHSARAEEGPDASTIVERALKKQSFEYEAGRAELKLEVESNGGDRSTKKMVVRTKEIDDTVRTRIELTHPEDLKGQSFLFVQREEGEDDVWTYVPAFDVTRRIEGSQKDGAFLGSHFTYADLESRSIKQSTYQKQGSETVGDHETYVVKATPSSDGESPYGSVAIYVRKSDYVPLKFVFHDDEGDVVKRLLVTKVATDDSGSKYVKQMKMRSEKGGYSVVTLTSVDPDATPPDSTFTKGQLGE